jgi:hypothetical protein
MFLDFYSTIYMGKKKPVNIAPSYYNSQDVMGDQIDKALSLGKHPVFVLVEVPKNLDTKKVPLVLLEKCDLVILLKQDSLEPEIVKALCQEHLGVAARWKSNLEQRAKIGGLYGK